MFAKSRRYLQILRVFVKYNLFSLLYKDIARDYISDSKCSCAIDLSYRSNASRLRKAFEELGPTFIKLGQTMSKRPDMIPMAYAMELENLQENVAALSFEAMRPSFETSCICESLDTEHHPLCYHCHSVHDVFDEFDEIPIASASIAQVYRAKIGAEDVVLKVARPDVLDIINLDLQILFDLKFIFMKVLGFGNNMNIDEFLEEFRRMLMRELDYRSEALNMERFRENFKESNKESHEGLGSVSIPKVYWDYCRDNILVMEFITGAPVSRYEFKSTEEKQKYARIISKSYLKQIYIDGFFHADPHSGNIFIKDDGGIAFIDFGAVGKMNSVLKKNLYGMFAAVYMKEPETAVEYFLKLANKRPDDVNMDGLLWDMDDLITKQHYSQFGERQSDNFVKLAIKHNIQLPGAFSTIERAIVLVEGVASALDPKYNIMVDAGEMIKHSMQAKYAPKSIANNVQKQGDKMYDIMMEVPGILTDVSDIVKWFKTVNIQHNAMKRNGDIGGIVSRIVTQFVWVVVLVLSASAAFLINDSSLQAIAFIVFVVTAIAWILKRH